jgi:hypothetical protein
MKEKILICTIVMLSVFMFLASTAFAESIKDTFKVKFYDIRGNIVELGIEKKNILCPCFTKEEVELILAQEGSTCSQYVGTALDDQGNALADTCTAVVCTVDWQYGCDPYDPRISAIEGPAYAAECRFVIGTETQDVPINECLYYEGDVFCESLLPQSVSIDEYGADTCIEILQKFLP